MDALRLQRCAFASGLLLGAIGCGGSGPGAARTSEGSAELGGDVVSTVDGVAIRIADVQSLAHDTGLSARAALSRLQSEALLMAEAERRGYGQRKDVGKVARQAAVQALLEGEVESLRATDAEIAAAYQAHKDRYVKPELRTAKHLLASLPSSATAEQEDAAHQFALRALHQLSITTDLDATFEALKQDGSPLFRVAVEALPPVPNGGAFVQPFMRALYAASATGPVAEPVRTEYGWHAIVVTKIEPATTVDLASAHDELAREIETQKRKQRLDSWLVELRAGVAVSYDKQGQGALGALEL